MNHSTSILLIGATGGVGFKIAQALLHRKVKLRILVRPESLNNSKKKALLRSLVLRGATIADGNLLNTESVKLSVENIDIIISALQGGKKLIVDGQKTLSKIGKEAGVRRIFPSTFSSELFAINTSDTNIVDNPIFKTRREAAQAIAATNLPATYLMNGTFMEGLLSPSPISPFNWKENVFEYWGDGKKLAAYTSISDAIRYLVEAVFDSSPPEQLRIAGDRLTMKEIKSNYEEVTEHRLASKRLGSLEDFRDKIESIKKKACSPLDPAYYQIRYANACGAGNLENLNNQLYPSVKPMNFRSILKTFDFTSVK